MTIHTGKQVARETAVVNIRVLLTVATSHSAVAPQVPITVLTTYNTSTKPLVLPISNKLLYRTYISLGRY